MGHKRSLEENKAGVPQQTPPARRVSSGVPPDKSKSPAVTLTSQRKIVPTPQPLRAARSWAAGDIQPPVTLCFN